MRLSIALVLTILLSACANQAMREESAWATSERAKAEAGQIKWSTHYRQVFDRLAALPPSSAGRADAMEWASILISAAELYEDGRMPPENFATIQRNYLASEARREERQSSQSAAAFGAALQNFGNTVYGPEATKARQIPVPAMQPTINCRTFGANTTCTQY